MQEKCRNSLKILQLLLVQCICDTQVRSGWGCWSQRELRRVPPSPRSFSAHSLSEKPPASPHTPQRAPSSSHSLRELLLPHRLTEDPLLPLTARAVPSCPHSPGSPVLPSQPQGASPSSPHYPSSPLLSFLTASGRSPQSVLTLLRGLPPPLTASENPFSLTARAVPPSPPSPRSSALSSQPREGGPHPSPQPRRAPSSPHQETEAQAPRAGQGTAALLFQNTEKSPKNGP